MTITYPLDFPTTLGFSSFTLKPRVAVSRSESPFTFGEQIYDWGGQIWEFNGTLPLMNRSTAEEYNSFLIKLKGRKGTFTMGIPGASSPRGTGTGTITVSGTGQTGATLTVTGFNEGLTDGVLKAGDYISIGTGSSTRLYKNLTDATTDTGGTTTLDIWPDLRSAPTDGTTITISGAKGLFRLADNVNPVSIDVNSFYSMNINGIEALDGT